MTRLSSMPGVGLLTVEDARAAASAAVSARGAACSGSIWLNASNGLEAAPHLAGEPFNVCRIQSTTFEDTSLWPDSTGSLPDQLLLELALGLRPVVVDLGARKAAPRALRQGIPVMLWQVARAWGLQTGPRLDAFSRDGARTVAFDEGAQAAASMVSRRQRARLRYWRKFVATDSIGCLCVCAPTATDGDTALHASQGGLYAEALRCRV